MKITLESTGKIVEFEFATSVPREKVVLPARLWQGHTESGVPVFAFITRIVPEVPEDDPEFVSKTVQFSTELMQQAAPRDALLAVPMRLIL